MKNLKNTNVKYCCVTLVTARGLELFNSWILTTAQQKNLNNYWDNFEAYVNPQASELINGSI